MFPKCPHDQNQNQQNGLEIFFLVSAAVHDQHAAQEANTSSLSLFSAEELQVEGVEPPTCDQSMHIVIKQETGWTATAYKRSFRCERVWPC